MYKENSPCFRCYALVLSTKQKYFFDSEISINESETAMAASSKNYGGLWLERSLRRTMYLVALLFILYSAPMTYAGKWNRHLFETDRDSDRVGWKGPLC